MSEAMERAEDVVAELTGNLIAAAIDNVCVTLDLLKVPPALANGPVLVVQPPKVKYITSYAAEYTWEVFIVAGPPQDRLAAWAALDEIVDALRLPMDLDDAEPATFSHPGMTDHAAYVVTFTETL